jgi:hypothetical protein
VVLVGISKWPYAAVAAALEVIPRTLAQVSYNTTVYCLLSACCCCAHTQPPRAEINSYWLLCVTSATAIPTHSCPPLESVHLLSTKDPVISYTSTFH